MMDTQSILAQVTKIERTANSMNMLQEKVYKIQNKMNDINYAVAEHMVSARDRLAHIHTMKDTE